MNDYLLYLLIIITILLIYFLYKIKNKKLFKEKIKIFTELIFFLTTSSFIFILFSAFRYTNMNYLKAIIIIVSLFLLVFSFGLITNNEKNYKTNINIYIGLYLTLLFSITFLIGRPRLNFNFNRITSIYKDSLIPFNTISLYFSGNASFKSIIYNIFGNIIMLVPLSFLLMIKNKKYNNILKQLLIIIPIVIFIELFQEITWTGAFDIDDIILNLTGPILFTFLITRFNFIDKIRKLFYNTFKDKKVIKYLIYIISLIIPIIFIIEVIAKVIIYI